MIKTTPGCIHTYYKLYLVVILRPAHCQQQHGGDLQISVNIRLEQKARRVCSRRDSKLLQIFTTTTYIHKHISIREI